MKHIARGLIRVYQVTLSPLLPSSCRFYPTCSQYGYEAIGKYGFFRGGWMTVKRVARCNPFCKVGMIRFRRQEVRGKRN